jgi:hypothetical protein
VSETAVLRRLTTICLALPETTTDDEHPPHRGFVVNKKNFAWFTVNEHGNQRVAVGVRTGGAENEELVAADPERFSLPKYVARHGWVNYFVDLPSRPPDWTEVAELVRESYLIQAPTRLKRLLGA